MRSQPTVPINVALSASGDGGKTRLVEKCARALVTGSAAKCQTPLWLGRGDVERSYVRRGVYSSLRV